MRACHSKPRPGGALKTVAALVAASMLAGCEAMAVTAFGVGASTGVSHSLNGVTYRTFTAPAQRVKSAALAALNRMGIKVDATKKSEGGEVIIASTRERQVEVELESISPNTTRMRVVAKQGSVFYDSATATEIILQTEKSMSNT